MDRRASTLLGLPLLITVTLGGCIGAGPTVGAVEAFVLEYEIVDLGRAEDTRYANPGHHCGDAELDDGLTIWLWPEEERPSDPWLAVFPVMPDDWRPSYGGAPFKTTMPRTISPGVHDDETPLGTFEWESRGDNGTLRIDGEAVSLPHAWSVAGGDGTWRMDAVLWAWDEKVAYERYDGLCD